MTKSLKYFGIAVVGILMGITAFGFYFTAAANPLGFSQGAKSATATTSVTYMTPGTATTTVLYDSFEVNGTNQNNNGNTWVPARAVVLIQVTGSSTNANVDMRLEYSMDNQDWFLFTSPGATTTQVVNLSGATVYRFGAVGERGGLITGTASTTRRAIEIDVPTRYIRAVYTLPAGGENAAVWAQIIPKKEVK